MLVCFFFFNDTATTEIYTLSLHDALPISASSRRAAGQRRPAGASRTAYARRLPPVSRRVLFPAGRGEVGGGVDRKSTRLNSSHSQISYAGFCLEKKKRLRDQYLFHSHQPH